MKSFDDILNRNHRVELDKAWEGSKTRRGIIAGMTYIVALVWLTVVENDPHPYINALVPSLGFLFSMMSMPIVKDWWIQKNEASADATLAEMEKQEAEDSEQEKQDD